MRVSRKKQLRTGFQPVEQKRNRRQIRELFPSGAVRGRIWPDLAKSGAPAAILINAYSGDFCHPVLSNALGQEPLVYHSGTRELFRTFSGHFRNFDFFAFFSIFVKFDKKCANLQIYIFTNARTFSKQNSQTRTSPKTFRACSQVSANVQMCKCANVQMCKKPSCTKCANLQRKYFSKCRNHKSALCTKTQMQISQMRKSAKCKFFSVQISVCKFRKNYLYIINLKIINK